LLKLEISSKQIFLLQIPMNKKYMIPWKDEHLRNLIHLSNLFSLSRGHFTTTNNANMSQLISSSEGEEEEEEGNNKIVKAGACMYAPIQ
jgi:hypothetical protein